METWREERIVYPLEFVERDSAIEDYRVGESWHLPSSALAALLLISAAVRVTIL